MTYQLLQGDVLEQLRTLPEQSVHTCVTSPPYWGLRDYGVDGQLGLEKTPQEYVAKMVEVFREVWRVLRKDGTCWLNLGDSYANDGKWGGSTGGKHASSLHGDSGIGRTRKTTGLKPKDLVGIPWRVAFALQEDGWYLRSDIIWAKTNPMPESVRDRPTRSHEYLFLLSKSPKYYYDADAIKEPAIYGSDDRKGRSKPHHKCFADDKLARINPEKQRGHSRRHAGFNDRWDLMDKREQCSGMRNKRDVWTVATKPYKEAHFATFPPKLIEPCILAGCPENGNVLDPFCGSGTTGEVSLKQGRNFIGIELNPTYVTLTHNRIGKVCGLFSEAV